MKIKIFDSLTSFSESSNLPLPIGKIEELSNLNDNKKDLEFLTKRLSFKDEIKYKKLLMEIVSICEDPNNRTNMSILKMSKFLDDLRSKILKEME
jgi:hypothetical protein